MQSLKHVYVQRVFSPSSSPTTTLKMPSYSLPSVVRGYNVYQTIWNAEEGEVLRCEREITNYHDPYAMAVVQDTVAGSSTVGHVP